MGVRDKVNNGGCIRGERSGEGGMLNKVRFHLILRIEEGFDVLNFDSAVTVDLV